VGRAFSEEGSESFDAASTLDREAAVLHKWVVTVAGVMDAVCVFLAHPCFGPVGGFVAANSNPGSEVDGGVESEDFLTF
jgi:hypothetical protein